MPASKPKISNHLAPAKALSGGNLIVAGRTFKLTSEINNHQSTIINRQSSIVRLNSRRSPLRISLGLRHTTLEICRIDSGVSMTADDHESPMNPPPRRGSSHAHRRSKARRYKPPHANRSAAEIDCPEGRSARGEHSESKPPVSTEKQSRNHGPHQLTKVRGCGRTFRPRPPRKRKQLRGIGRQQHLGIALGRDQTDVIEGFFVQDLGVSDLGSGRKLPWPSSPPPPRANGFAATLAPPRARQLP